MLQSGKMIGLGLVLGLSHADDAPSRFGQLDLPLKFAPLRVFGSGKG